MYVRIKNKNGPILAELFKMWLLPMVHPVLENEIIDLDQIRKY